MKVFTTVRDVADYIADSLEGVSSDFDSEEMARQMTTYDEDLGGLVFLPQYDDSLDEDGQERDGFDPDAFDNLVERLDLGRNREVPDDP